MVDRRTDVVGREIGEFQDLLAGLVRSTKKARFCRACLTLVRRGIRNGTAVDITGILNE